MIVHIPLSNLQENPMNPSAIWHTWLSTHLILSPATVDRLTNRFERVNLPADSETLEHALKTTRLACDLADKVGFPAEQRIAFRHGALLHDLGKLLIPPEILAKTTPLTSEDWAVLKRHTDYTYLLLCDIPELDPALEIPTAHHECWDGSGYPRGLKGEAIPLAARIYSIADVWDALLSPRPFRPAFTFSKARDILTGLSGKQFDPVILGQFIATLPGKGNEC
jgi:HD-GYP domain-containing protein (c-di-GMP phosphodiesterase class II)